MEGGCTISRYFSELLVTTEIYTIITSKLKGTGFNFYPFKRLKAAVEQVKMSQNYKKRFTT